MMFGIIVAGRLVQTDMQQVGETQFVFNIPEADHINHVVVFMTGQTPFPDTMGGSVYFCWPSEGGTTWHLLGHIHNNKPSAIFKVSNLHKDKAENTNPFGAFNQQTHMAQIGVSIDPLTQISQQTPADHTGASTMSNFMEFATKMVENLLNYTSSFGITQAQMTPNPSETFVPLSTLQQWYGNFQRKLQLNPNFWKS